MRKYKRLTRFRDRPRYRKTSTFLTEVERDMLKALQDMVGSGLKVYPNVRLYDLLELAGGREETNTDLAVRLRCEVVDFVVCDARTSAPTLVVELRNTSDETADTIERNDFVEWILSTASLPLLLISRESPQSIVQLAQVVQSSLSEYIRKSSAAA